MVTLLAMLGAGLVGFGIGWSLAFDEHRADYYRQLDLITRKLDSLLSIGGQMASTLAELNASLDDIKVGLAAHADKLAEIGLDLDDLIAKLGSGTTDQEALDAAVAKATEIKAAIQAESDQLDSLRSKHETA